MLTLQVVIPAFNEEKVLPRCLGALRIAASRASAMIVLSGVLVSDGDSRDGTRDVAVEGGCEVVRRGRDDAAGRGAALNRAIENIFGEAGRLENDPPRKDIDIILFLHADCILGPDSLLALAAVYSEEPQQNPPSSNCPSCIMSPSPPSSRTDASVFHPHFILPPFAPLSRRLFFSACTSWISGGFGLFKTFGDQGLALRPSVLNSLGGFPPWPLFEDVGIVSKILKSKKYKLSRVPPCLPNSSTPRDSGIGIDTRRFDNRGDWSYAATCFKLIAMFQCGVPPAKLARLYAS